MGTETDLRCRLAFRGEDKDTKLLPNVAAKAKRELKKKKKKSKVALSGILSD